MFQQIRAYAEEAKRHGLVVILWSYPRGSALSKQGETAIDVIGYSAQIAAQLGAHIIKVKLPDAFVEQEAARKVYTAQKFQLQQPLNVSAMLLIAPSLDGGSLFSLAAQQSRMKANC